MNSGKCLWEPAFGKTAFGINSELHVLHACNPQNLQMWPDKSEHIVQGIQELVKSELVKWTNSSNGGCGVGGPDPRATNLGLVRLGSMSSFVWRVRSFDEFICSRSSFARRVCLFDEFIIWWVCNLTSSFVRRDWIRRVRICLFGFEDFS